MVWCSTKARSKPVRMCSFMALAAPLGTLSHLSVNSRALKNVEPHLSVNRQTLKALGWTPFVYSNKDWTKAARVLGGADVLFDSLSFESWDEFYSVLSAHHGLLIGYGGNLASFNDEPARGLLCLTTKLLSRNLMCPVEHQTTRFFYITRDGKTFEPDLKALFELLGQNKIEVRIKAVCGLEDIREAHNCWGNSPGIGSMLINVGAK